MIQLASAAKIAQLDNGNSPTEPTLSEAERAFVDVFLDNILGILPVVGVHAFEQSSKNITVSLSMELTCQGNGAKATGYDSPQGFVVHKGSSVAINVTQSLRDHLPHIVKLRDELQKSGVIANGGTNLQFAQDFIFSSPSAASSVVLGHSSNGRTAWKDAAGRTLKQIQEAQAAS